MNNLDGVQVGKVLHALEERRQDLVGLISRQRDVYLPEVRL